MKIFLERFSRDWRGTSAVEFALCLPVMLIALVGVIDVGHNMYQRSDMEGALRSGIQYFMNGGTDVETAVSIVDAAWTDRPEGAEVVSEQFCLCGTQASVCTQLCSDGSYPVSYRKITARVLLAGVISQGITEASQSVRVR
jgi:Flp pilus assembly protein TadG